MNIDRVSATGRSHLQNFPACEHILLVNTYCPTIRPRFANADLRADLR